MTLQEQAEQNVQQARLLYDKGRWEEAITHYLEALRLYALTPWKYWKGRSTRFLPSSCREAVEKGFYVRTARTYLYPAAFPAESRLISPVFAAAPDF